MIKEYYAKSKLENGHQPTVKEHLTAVAELAEQYGNEFERGEEAKIAGMFHDFGKYSASFQNVLLGLEKNIDHAMCGATFLSQMKKDKIEAYEAIIEVIHGHHDGLISFDELQPTLEHNFFKEEKNSLNNQKKAALVGKDEYKKSAQCFQEDFPNFRFPRLKKSPLDVEKGLEERNVETMLYTRMLFSCLVDADYSASAMDSNSDYLLETERLEFEAKMWQQRLLDYREKIVSQTTADLSLNQMRNKLFWQCGKMGELPEGLFTLTAPTGTGKTLALLHFALQHCIVNEKRRIIVVLPFLALAEQSADTYSKIVSNILVDHSQSNLDDEVRDFASRWSVPFIITTSVKFFESLFAKKPTDCRKLHHLANSVVLFDEAQSLPVELTQATLQAVNALCKTYHCTMVFSSATQPDFGAIPNVDWKPTEIMPEYPEMFQALRRTHVEWKLEQPVSLEKIACEMSRQTSVCAVVNLRKHARKLFMQLKELCKEEELFFITTDLCMAHRRIIIEEIVKRLKNNLPCRVVATQCIEAGVDLDFDVLYRTLAPLDSIIQAAGRCNRNGRLAGGGRVIVFEPEEEGSLYPGGCRQRSKNWYESAAIIVKRLWAKRSLDIHNPERMKEYYKELFAGQEDKAALKTALQKRSFADVEKEYALIDNKGVKVIVPIPREISDEENEKYKKLERELKKGITPLFMRKAAELTVTVPFYQQEKLKHYLEQLEYAGKQYQNGESVKSEYYILRKQYEKYYTKDMGLQLPEEIEGGNVW